MGAPFTGRTRTLLVVLAAAALVWLAAACRRSGAEDLTVDGSSLRLAWTFEAGGPLNRPPVCAGDVLAAAPQAGPIYALDGISGERLWVYPSESGRVWENSLAAGDEHIYAGMPGGRLVALKARTGTLAWETSLGIEVQAPPRAAGNRLYVSTTHVGPGLESNPQGRATVFALDARTGRELWSFESGNYILQTPFVYEDTVYVAGSYSDPAQEVDEGGPMRIYALSARDGSVLWAYEALDGYTKALYATADIVAYVAYTDYVTGLDARTGQQVWRRDTGNWAPGLAGSGQVLYYGSANTKVQALDMASGELIWEYDIPEGSFNYLLTAPVRVADDLYFLTQRGELVGLNALDGAQLWMHPTHATARVGLTTHHGWLYFGDEDGRIYAFK